MPTKRVTEGIRKFQQNVHPDHESNFLALKDGQQPEVLMIACSDSRIDPALFTQTLPGDLFVIRNAGNLVGRHDPAGDAQAGTIEYAVKALGVKHIVVCGHARCGAMAAVMDPESAAGLPAVAAWLRKAGPPRVPAADASLDDQVRLNVITQLQNLRTHPSVQQAESNGSLQLHGWVYDFVTGQVVELSEKTGDFAALDRTGDEIGAV